MKSGTWFSVNCRIFSADEPARGLVFALALLTFGNWTVCAVSALTSGFEPFLLNMASGGICSPNFPVEFNWSFWLLIFLPLSVLYGAVVLVLFLRRYLRRLPEVRPGAAAALVCWAGTLFGIWAGLFMLTETAGLFAHYGSPDPDLCFPLSHPAVWVWCGVLCAPVGWTLTAGVCARLACKPWREIVGRETRAVLALFIGVYAVSLILAYSAQRNADRNVAELAEFFGSPMTPETLRRAYFDGRRTDAEFREKTDREMSKTFWGNDIIDRLKFADPFSAGQSEAAEVRRAFAAIPGLSMLEKAFDAPVPADPGVFAPGKPLADTMPPPAAHLRFAQLQGWRVRFAAEDGDAAAARAARAALRRMANLRRMYSHERLLISALLLIRIEELRLRAIVRFLDAGLATEEERAAFRRELTALAADVPDFQRRTMQGEMIFALDTARDIVRGTVRNGHKRLAPDLTPVRLVFPPLWRIAALNFAELARLGKSAVFSGLQRKRYSDRDFLCGLIAPVYSSAGARFDALSAHYRDMLKCNHKEKRHEAKAL